MAKKIRLDFSKVEERSGWNTKEIPEGLHEMKVVAAEVGEAKDGTDMITYALVPTSPKYKTRRFPYYCKLQQNQLWKLRDLIVATGGTVPKKVTNIDPDLPVGKLIAAEVSDETGQYAGRSTVDGTYGIDILDDDNDGEEPDDDEEYDDEADEADEVDEDEVDDEDEEDEEDEEEDLSGLTIGELRKRAKGLGIDHAGVKKDDLIELILEEEADGEEEDDDEDDLDDEDLDDEELEDEEFEDDEDEEEEPPAKPARKAPARKPASAPTRRVKRR